MTQQLGILMDPIKAINIRKDSSFAMLLAAQARTFALLYMEQQDVFLRDGQPWGRMRNLSVRDDPTNWYEFGGAEDRPLASLDILLMRKDPPLNMEFVYSTQLLELAERQGVLVINRPASLRDCNEKLFTAWFPQCCVPTLVTRNAERLRDFLADYRDIILKPLDSMGGASIFRVQTTDPNIGVIIETLTERGQRSIMAQRFIPAIAAGDKRILLVDGEPVPYALARIPAEGETRGNLAAGGRGEGVALTERDHWICQQVGPELRRRGLMFVGLDVIGDYLTEINVTSPTCIRELDRQFGLDIAGQLVDAIVAVLSNRS